MIEIRTIDVESTDVDYLRVQAKGRFVVLPFVTKRTLDKATGLVSVQTVDFSQDYFDSTGYQQFDDKKAWLKFWLANDFYINQSVSNFPLTNFFFENEASFHSGGGWPASDVDFGYFFTLTIAIWQEKNQP